LLFSYESDGRLQTVRNSSGPLHPQGGQDSSGPSTALDAGCARRSQMRVGETASLRRGRHPRERPERLTDARITQTGYKPSRLERRLNGAGRVGVARRSLTPQEVASEFSQARPAT
jgi:hypothetical protein